VFAGAWLENGDSFDDWQHAGLRSNCGTGVVLDTLFVPVLLGGSWDFDGRCRTYFAVGRVFRLYQQAPDQLADLAQRHAHVCTCGRQPRVSLLAAQRQLLIEAADTRSNRSVHYGVELAHAITVDANP